MVWWLYILIAFVSVLIAFCGNYFLQKRLLKIQNQERGIDFLIGMIEKLESLYSEYWNKESHCKKTSLKIKATQTQILNLLNFLYEKYSLKNKGTIKSLLQQLITQSTNENFDSLSRKKPNLDKSVEIAKYTNKVILELLRSKI
jgi:hypothetical protein